MGKTDPDAATHRQQSMVLVPRDTPGVTIERDLPVFGHHDQHGHAVISFTDVEVPVTSVVGEEGGRLRGGAGPSRPGPHPPLHARARRRGTRARDAGRAGQRPRGLRRAARRSGRRHPGGRRRRGWRSSRRACCACSPATSSTRRATRRPGTSSRWPRSLSRARRRTSSIARSRCTAAPGSPTRRRCRPCTPGTGRCALFDGPDEVHVRGIGRSEMKSTPALPPGPVTA